MLDQDIVCGIGSYQKYVVGSNGRYAVIEVEPYKVVFDDGRPNMIPINVIPLAKNLTDFCKMIRYDQVRN